jgi:hypothetical protein
MTRAGLRPCAGLWAGVSACAGRLRPRAGLWACAGVPVCADVSLFAGLPAGRRVTACGRQKACWRRGGRPRL